MAATVDRPAEARPNLARRAAIHHAWRFYALASLIPLAIFADLLVGPSAQEPFEPLMGVDFGAFYSGAMLVREGRVRELGEMEAQRDAQRRLHEREQTGWRWYNALPHPPVTILPLAPLADLPLRTAFWLWVAAGLVAAGAAALTLARALVPAPPLAAAAILVSFEPIWDVAWWGQLDSFLLLPVAAGAVLLLRPPDRRRDLAAGVLLGFLALKPIFVPVPFLALLWGRPWASVGMAASGGILAAVSVAAVGIDGVRDYVELSRYYQQFTGSPAIVEWRMYNLRGLAIRLGLDGESVGLAFVLAASLALAILTVVVAGRALRAHRSPDLALGLVILGTIVTAYHVHVQSLVFLTIPLAAWIGRSLAAASTGPALFWAAPVVAIHGGAMLLRPHLPSPAPTEARIETFLTIGCLAALVFVVLVLVAPRCARQLDANPTAGPIGADRRITHRSVRHPRVGESPKR